jgi:Flp pilus assembly protein TadG
MSLKKQSGAAAMELALLLPFLLLMVDGVVEFGILLHNQSVLITGSSMAARAGSAAGINKLTTSQITKLAQDYCNANLMMLASNSTVVTTVVQSPEPSFQLPLRVTVQYTYQGMLIGGFLSAFQNRPVMFATSVMYNE